MKKYLIIFLVILLVGLGIYFLMGSGGTEEENQNEENQTNIQEQENGLTENEENQTEEQEDKTQTIIGQSVEGRDIIAYHYGDGGEEVVFISGAHGGYEWNAVMLAYQAMDYFKENSGIIPQNLKITVIPALNVDGLYKVTGKEGVFTSADVSSSSETQVAGRFNANNVDLNRNFDCNWKAEGVWLNKTVSGGDSAFSEPESLAIKNYILNNTPVAVVGWYSAAGVVIPANDCSGNVMSEAQDLADAYVSASGYKAQEEFDFYALSGDMTNWIVKNNIPAISVLLTDHENVEWTKNLAGIQAILDYYKQ